MDGYAVQAADTGSGEVRLRLNEMVGAGSVARLPVAPGTATAIMTGAPMPEGADAVVVVEETDGARAGEVRVRAAVQAGQNVRPRGNDVRAGQVVLQAGATLSPPAVGLASSLGLPELRCRRRPVVALLSTGDELVEPGEPLAPGQIYASNSVALAGLVHAAGGEVLDLGNVPDDPEALVAALRRGAAADVVVSTGGVSVGEFDHVKGAYADLGVALDFWKVKMKPGKPLAFGRLEVDGRSVAMFGLPGNPVSCLVNFLQFVRPWLRTALGDPTPFLPVVRCTARGVFREKVGRAKLMRVSLSAGPDGWEARSTGSQSSGVLTSMVLAHGLLLVGIDAPIPEDGDEVRVQLLDTSFLAGASASYGW
jgi:molybdopterin molybdotransferase